MPSRAAYDRLGERLRERASDEPDDLIELLEFCQVVKEATAQAYEIVSGATVAPVVARSGKSFRSIIEKLQRQPTVRLTQIQDIEGCRVVVDSRVEQDALCFRLCARFSDVKVDDKRVRPTNGYRAIHVIAQMNKQRYEIQIRTRLQHAWAQIIELFADALDPSIKYGGGSQELIDNLHGLALSIDGLERVEAILTKNRLGYGMDMTELRSALDGMVPPQTTDDLMNVFSNDEDMFESFPVAIYDLKGTMETLLYTFAKELKRKTVAGS